MREDGERLEARLEAILGVSYYVGAETRQVRVQYGAIILRTYRIKCGSKPVSLVLFTV